MAAATSTLKVNAYPKGVDNTQTQTVIYGVCALSAGGTYVTNGVPLNWENMTDLNTGNAPFVLPAGTSQTQPLVAYFQTTTGATGYSYVFDTVHNTLRIFNGGTELTNGGSITADTIGFEAHFVRNVN